MKALPYSRVYVEITNVCNRNCSFCPGTSRAAGRMSYESFSRVLDGLSGLTEYIYLHVMGEPLTHPELARLIELASSLGFKVALTTNGTLLSTLGTALLNSPVYKVNISLHSFEDGSDEAYLSYIGGCLDFADAASARGILTVLRLWNRGFDGGRNIDTLGLIKARFPSGEWREGSRGARIRHRLHLEYDDRFSWPDMSADELGARVFCHGLGDHFAILCDGTVVPCCLDHNGDIPLGNALNTPVSEILASDRAVKMRESFLEKRASEELCRRCGYARRFKI